MELANDDLQKIIRKLGDHKMKFTDFFTIFKDTIMGLVFMHTQTIAHRDIKPGNILKMASKKFALADYGEGINLSGEEKYNEKDFNYISFFFDVYSCMGITIF